MESSSMSSIGHAIVDHLFSSLCHILQCKSLVYLPIIILMGIYFPLKAHYMQCCYEDFAINRKLLLNILIWIPFCWKCISGWKCWDLGLAHAELQWRLWTGFPRGFSSSHCLSKAARTGGTPQPQQHLVCLHHQFLSAYHFPFLFRTYVHLK